MPPGRAALCKSHCYCDATWAQLSRDACSLILHSMTITLSPVMWLAAPLLTSLCSHDASSAESVSLWVAL